MGYLLYAEEMALAQVEPESVNVGGLGAELFSPRVQARLTAHRMPPAPGVMAAIRARQATGGAVSEAQRAAWEVRRQAHRARVLADRARAAERMKAHEAARLLRHSARLAEGAARRASMGERWAALHAARTAFYQQPGQLTTTGLTGLDGRPILQDATHFYVPVSGPFEGGLGEAEYVWIGHAPHLGLGDLGGWFKKLTKKVKKVVKKAAKVAKKVVKAVKKPLVGGALIIGGVAAIASGAGLPVGLALVGGGVGVIAKKGTGFGKPLEVLKRTAIGAAAGAATGWLLPASIGGSGGAALIGGKIWSGAKLAGAGIKAIGGKLFGPKGKSISELEAQDMLKKYPEDSPAQQAAAFDWSKVPVGQAIAIGGALFAKDLAGKVAQVDESAVETGEGLMPTGGEITYPSGAVPAGGSGGGGFAPQEGAPEGEGAPVAAAPSAGAGGGAAAAVLVGGLTLLALASR